MLQENCRIEKFNGYRFYEQDILYDDYMFSNDIQLTVDLDYVSPGFGIALIDNEGFSIKEKRFAYLFKIGYREASIYYSTPEKNTLVKQLSVKEAFTIQENMKLTFIKQSKKIIIKINDVEILSEYTSKSIDKYNIGYYSNIGNIINSISIASAIPDKWTINMNNTQGGYIKFYNNCFELKDCKYAAEIEQSKILLQPGHYYLKFETDNVNERFDIKHYIHKSDDEGLFDEEKNILKKDNSFFLLQETEVNLKFVGTQGVIKKVMITDDKEDNFIPTYNNNFTFEASYIDVYMSDVKRIKWTGEINRTPGDLTSNEIFGLIMDSKTIITPQMTPIVYGKTYDFEFSKDNYMFTIRKGKDLLYSQQLKNLNNKLTIFKNITAVISSFVLTKTNGEEVDVNLQDEYKRYVNANITGPIIVLDQYDNPLDLSSSFRLCHYKDHSRYVFTNHEREYFYPQKKLKLVNKMINKQDTVRVFGIHKTSNYDLEKIYDVNEDNINSIDLMTDRYDILFESDLLHVDKTKNLIYLTQDQIEKYQLIVVDYLKDNSYCINYHYDKHVYEVDISSLQPDNKMVYDTKVLLGGDKEVTQTREHKITNINGNTNGYIVIRKGVS